MPRHALLAAVGFALVACSSSHPAASASPDASPGDDTADASPADASLPDVDKSESCAPSFGDALATVGFARFDGTVVAVVPPNDQGCAEPNSTHLVVQLAMGGATYRMVVDVSDLGAPGTIRAKTIPHALVGGPWQDGWRAVPLDYPTTLGVHSADFAPESTADAVAAITGALDLGAHVSVFATAQGESDSAHLVHRNGANADGAIVVHVDDASPTWLLFSFASYSF
jgi:hypothetical protein